MIYQNLWEPSIPMFEWADQPLLQRMPFLHFTAYIWIYCRQKGLIYVLLDTCASDEDAVFMHNKGGFWGFRDTCCENWAIYSQWAIASVWIGIPRTILCLLYHLIRKWEHCRREQILYVHTNPFAQVGYDTGAIFKRSLIDLSSEFSIS